MKKRPKQRISDSQQPTMLESLELRRLLSAAPVGSISFGSLTASVDWVPAATASAHLTAARDGSLWYTAGNAVEHYTPGGLTSVFTLPASYGAGATVSSLAVTADGSAWFTVNRGTGSDLLRVTGGTEFFASSSAAPMGNLAAAGNSVWATVGSDTLEQFVLGAGSISIHVAGVSAFTGLSADAEGNAWFSASTAAGEGLVGKVTAGGVITTYDVAAQPADIAAGNGSVFFGEQGAIWRIGADGVMTKTAFPVTPRGLTAATDGGAWFIDGSNAGYPLGHLAVDGSVVRYSTAPQSVPNSLAMTADGTLWVMASGAVGKWQLHGSTFDNAGDVIFLTANSYVQGNMALGVVTRGSLGNFVLSNGGTILVTNDVDTSTGTVSESQSTTTTTTTATTTATTTTTTGPTPNDNTGHGAGPAISVNDHGVPRQAMGDPGAFDGEFAVTARQAIPDREKQFTNSHLQSNAGSGNKGIATGSTFHVAGLPGEGNRATAELTLLARVAVEGDGGVAGAAAVVPEGGGGEGAGLGKVVQVVEGSGKVSGGGVAAGAAGAEEAVVPASNVSRWWKLAICMSSAVGIELGRGGQRYFRV